VYARIREVLVPDNGIKHPCHHPTRNDNRGAIDPLKVKSLE